MGIQTGPKDVLESSLELPQVKLLMVDGQSELEHVSVGWHGLPRFSLGITQEPEISMRLLLSFLPGPL